MLTCIMRQRKECDTTRFDANDQDWFRKCFGVLRKQWLLLKIPFCSGNHHHLFNPPGTVGIIYRPAEACCLNRAPQAADRGTGETRAGHDPHCRTQCRKQILFFGVLCSEKISCPNRVFKRMQLWERDLGCCRLGRWKENRVI